MNPSAIRLHPGSRTRCPGPSKRADAGILIGRALVLCGALWLTPRAEALPDAVPAFAKDFAPLIDSSCIDCHDAETKTTLNFEILGHDLSDPAIFRRWEKIYDQVRTGEMPPKKKARPDPALVKSALHSLQKELHATSRAAQVKDGRVPVRRLTATEYEYTLHDLLEIRNDLSKHLPPENQSARFDTIATGQGISPVHIRSYLAAAEVALDEAIKLGRRPRKAPYYLDYMNSRYVDRWFKLPLRRGGNTIKKVEDAVVTFDYRPHPLRSDHMGYHPPSSGLYRIMIGAYGYQAKTPVTLILIKASDKRGTSELVGIFDIEPGTTRTATLTTYLTPDDYIYPVGNDLDWDPQGRSIFARATGGAAGYQGEGLAISWLTIQGPLEESWPPVSTRKLLRGVELVERGDRRGFVPTLKKEPLEHVKEIVEGLAPALFRRPLKDDEADLFIGLAKPALDEGRSFEQALRIPLRALLSSPQFLFHAGDPGRLDDHALASRLSYFLWRSLPDEELFRLAREKKLSDSKTLAAQVDRMLADEKSMRFVRDFLGQWLGLHQIDATTPDDKLYPEYDDVLRQAMLRESELFFQELIVENLPVRNLIDSEFTYLNGRLARHYGIRGLTGEQFRKVSLPADSVRGGFLTQASVLKVTANGTVTSPVKRGAFVLATLLGKPPSPPPADVGSIEPDTRGTTTIRETLDAHRNVKSCARCHREIDPPGFALECFDPIGGYRTRYRSTGKGDWSKRILFGRRVYEYKEGRQVDATGVTAGGKQFAGIRDFKRLLLAQEEDVARNLLSNLMVYATGGEIQFADREELDELLERSREDQYPIRTMIHQVVQSEIFNNK
ncbi:MAG: DUF1592 domain-containing protein [Roseibacillus sp.]